MYLLDTDFLVSLSFTAEPNHKRAVEIERQFLEHQKSSITELVLQECATVISCKYSQTDAIGVTHTLRDGPSGIIPFDSQLMSASWELFDQQTHRRTSFIDCSNVVMARALGCKVVSFDRFYEQFVDIRI